eukprot:UN06517
MEEFRIKLKMMGLSRFIPAFEENGYDDLQFYPGLTDSELEEMGIKRGFLKKWRKVYKNPNPLAHSLSETSNFSSLGDFSKNGFNLLVVKEGEIMRPVVELLGDNLNAHRLSDPSMKDSVKLLEELMSKATDIDAKKISEAIAKLQQCTIQEKSEAEVNYRTDQLRELSNNEDFPEHEREPIKHILEQYMTPKPSESVDPRTLSYMRSRIPYQSSSKGELDDVDHYLKSRSENDIYVSPKYSPKSSNSRSHDEEFGRQVSRPIVFDDKLLAGGVDRSSKFSNRKRVSFRQNLEDVHMMSRSESLGTPLVSMEIDEQLIKASEQAQSNAHSASDMSSGYLEPEVNNLEVFEKHLKNNKLKKQLERLPSWNFDIFAIYNECQNFTLPVLCLSIFHDLEIEKN